MKYQNYYFPKFLFLILLTLPVYCQGAGKFSLSFAPTYISGKYGQQDTTHFGYFPLTAKYKYNKWKFRLLIPYLIKSGPRNVIIGIGTINERQEVQNTTETGLGDIISTVDYQVYYNPKHKFLLDLRAKVKFGTADPNKALGTGKTDFSIRTGLYKVIGDWTPYVRVGYRIYGTNRLNNVVFASGGFNYKISEKQSGGIDFFWRDRLIDSISQHRVLNGYLTQKLDKNWKIQEYVITGFGDRSPNWGLGLNFGYTF